MRAGPPARFGSGNNYAGLESRNSEGFVALFGQYTPIRDPFTYDPKEEVYRCSYGAVLKNYGLRMMGGYGNYYYFSKVSACKDCPIKVKCCGKKQRKRLVFTMYRNHYERMQKRLTSARGRGMKKLRSSTVEPVTVRRRGWEFIELLWHASFQCPWSIVGPQTDVNGSYGLQPKEMVGEKRLAQSRYPSTGSPSRQPFCVF